LYADHNDEYIDETEEDNSLEEVAETDEDTYSDLEDLDEFEGI